MNAGTYRETGADRNPPLVKKEKSAGGVKIPPIARTVENNNVAETQSTVNHTYGVCDLMLGYTTPRSLVDNNHHNKELKPQ